ncbi:MAG: cytochrome C biogenesis protein, partial [Bacteroidota bacterium]
EKYALSEKDIAVSAQLEIIDVNKKIYHSEPVFIIKNNVVFSEETTIDDLGLRLSFKKINPETGKFEITVSERKENKREFIIMKAIIFPWINILWTGCILMIIGTFIAIRKRIADLRR